MRLRNILLLCLVSLCSLMAVQAQNITGRITANGKGVRNVVVSDGDEVALTNAEGRYELQSQKRNGYVFYSLPRGYQPTYKNGFQPRFWSALKNADANVSEVHDFELLRQRSSSDRYVMLFGADVHLARKNNDLKQFEGFLAALEREQKLAGKRTLHSIFLGDISWDAYWTSQKFGLPQLVDFLQKSNYPLPLWTVMGNHDHDPSIPEGRETDFLTSGEWRKVMGPNYYSFNLGRLHYVVLDDIVYLNEDKGGKYKKGIVGSRNYTATITDEQFKWLEKDLAMVKDKSAPLIIAVHIPVWRLNETELTVKGALTDGGAERLAELLRDFKEVHIVSGHVHVNYTAHPTDYPNITEHNIAAVCATWWRSGNLSGEHINKDGSPGGYSRWEVDGKRVKFSYCSFDKGDAEQVRIYDMNKVSERYSIDPFFKGLLESEPNRTDFSKVPANTVMFNVYAYDKDWKIEVLEGGKPISFERVTEEDPFHTIAFSYAKFQRDGKFGDSGSGRKTYHMFKAQAKTADQPITVIVKDNFGRKYKHTIQRPHPYEI